MGMQSGGGVMQRDENDKPSGVAWCLKPPFALVQLKKTCLLKRSLPISPMPSPQMA